MQTRCGQVEGAGEESLALKAHFEGQAQTKSGQVEGVAEESSALKAQS